MTVTDKDMAHAIRILIEWIGDDPNRDGLKDTPRRIIARYKKIFSGYQTDMKLLLKPTTIKEATSNDMVMVNDIEFISFCEHHILPMTGKIDVAYLPDKNIAGLGTIIKIVNAIARRLQLQERLTTQIADTINNYLKPKGIAVLVRARHYCLDRESTGQGSSLMQTCHMLGDFKKDHELQNQLFNLTNTRNNYEI